MPVWQYTQDMAQLRQMLNVKVVPGASRNRVVGRYGDGVKIQVAAAPERGRANEAVIEVLAQWLGVRSSQLEIVKGQAQPRKTVAIEGITGEMLMSRMESLA